MKKIGRYNIYHIPKSRHGTVVGYRVIEEPDEGLKARQKELLHLYQQLPFHPSVHGIPGTSNKTNAERHIRSKIIIKLDIKDFFPSVTKDLIIDGIYEIYNCNSISIDREEIVRSIDDCVLYDSRRNYYRLPQGAPTSPILSSIAFYPFDRKINRLCAEYNLLYTRYIDDLTFSGTFHPKRFIPNISKILQPHFRLNYRKTESLHSTYQSQQVTGVTINKKLSVPRKYRMILRAKLDNIARAGNDIDDSVRGELSYVYSINKEQYDSLVNHYERRKEFYSKCNTQA